MKPEKVRDIASSKLEPYGVHESAHGKVTLLAIVAATAIERLMLILGPEQGKDLITEILREL